MLRNLENETYVLNTILDIWPESEEIIDRMAVIPTALINGRAFVTFNPHYVASEIMSLYTQGKDIIVFDSMAEAVGIPFAQYLDEVYKLCKHLPNIKFVFFTGSLTGQEDYDNICEFYNIDKNLKILACSFFERSANKTTTEYNKEYVVEPKLKKFLCFNRVERQHRIDLLQHMLTLDLVKDSFYSFSFTEPGSFEILKSINENNARGKYDIIIENMDKIPMVLNRTTERDNPVQVLEEDFYYFENSYISIVPETLYYKQLVTEKREYSIHIPSTERGVFPSEKIFKPIFMRHPFIHVGVPHFLEKLRERGYQTFHPYIDETYDVIDDDEVRLQTIVNEIERLSKLNTTEWLAMLDILRPRIEHNHEVLMNATDFRVTKNIDFLK